MNKKFWYFIAVPLLVMIIAVTTFSLIWGGDLTAKKGQKPSKLLIPTIYGREVTSLPLSGEKGTDNNFGDYFAFDPHKALTPKAGSTATPTKTPTKTPIPTPTKAPVPTKAATATPTKVPAATQVPGSGNGGGTSTEMTGQENQWAHQLFDLINQDRKVAGLPPYVWDANLTKAAMGHNKVMAAGCGLSHQCPNEPSMGQRITNAGYRWSAAAENCGVGSSSWNTVVGLHRAMMNETPPNDGHRKNLMSTTYQHVGVAIFIDVNGKVWITEDFGKKM